MTLPLIGTWLDRCGPRVVFTFAAVGLAVGCWAYAHVWAWWQLPAVYYVLRMCGQGSIVLSCNNAMTIWFVRLRSRVLSVAAVANSFVLGGVFSTAMKAETLRSGYKHAYSLCAPGGVGPASSSKAAGPDAGGHTRAQALRTAVF